MQCKMFFGPLGGGGGGGSAPQRSAKKEWPQITQWYGGQENQYLDFIQKDPLLSMAYPFAQESLTNVPRLTGTLENMLRTGGPALETAYGNVADVLQRGGALTQEQEHDVNQATRAGEAARGMATTLPGLAEELLNRDTYRRQRFQEAIGQAGQLEGVAGALPAEIQGIRGTGLNQLLATEQTGVKSFSELTNPILSYLSNLFSGNQQAAVQAQTASANKAGGTAGGAMSAIGSVLGAVATAY